MSDNKLSEVEAELYDRQIRLWGIESQEKLRAANVLLINIRGLGSEIAKNILLAGINSLTILDDGIVTKEEQAKNFLLHQESIGKKIAEEILIKAQALNPLVKITADTDSPSSKDMKYFEQFTIIVATGIKTDLLLKIDKVCRSSNVKLIYGDVFGMFGCAVSDFHKHSYYEDRIQLVGKKRSHDGEEKTVVKVQGTIEYPELKKVLILPNTKQNIESIRNKKIRNNLFFVMLTLIEFRNRKGRDPAHTTKDEDIASLMEIKKEMCDLYGVPEDKINEDIFSLIFGEIVPSCAVVGGIIAQEVIKGVSQKEYISYGDKHDHDTRNKDKLCVEFSRLTRTRAGVNYFALKFYNKLPDRIKSLSGEKFKQSVKMMLIDGTFYSIDEYLAQIS